MSAADSPKRVAFGFGESLVEIVDADDLKDRPPNSSISGALGHAWVVSMMGATKTAGYPACGRGA
jgi:hypothetical protein